MGLGDFGFFEGIVFIVQPDCSKASLISVFENLRGFGKWSEDISVLALSFGEMARR